MSGAKGLTGYSWAVKRRKRELNFSKKTFLANKCNNSQKTHEYSSEVNYAKKDLRNVRQSAVCFY